MKAFSRKTIALLLGCTAIVMVVGAVAWRERQDISDLMRRADAGPLPPAQSKAEIVVPVTAPTPTPLPPPKEPTKEELVELSEQQPTTNPPPDPAKIDPPTPALPPAINLQVPMVYQAPFSNWDALHEDACEEASLLMVKYFHEGKVSVTREKMDIDIKALVAHEMSTLGFFESTTAPQNVELLKEYFDFTDVRIEPFTDLNVVRQHLVAGRPILLPANGKLLGNPNFRNGGPAFHMLVIKGYMAKDRFITNDPGTRKGADYVYDGKTLLNAAADWNGHNLADGAKVVIVVYE